MFLGSREQLEVVLSRTTEPGAMLRASKMHTFVKEAKAGKNVVSGREVVGNVGSLKSERKNVKTIRAKSIAYVYLFEKIAYKNNTISLKKLQVAVPQGKGLPLKVVRRHTTLGNNV